MTKSGVIRYVASLPVGEYRSVLGAIRRAWKAKQTGRPVKRLRRTIRLTAEDIRWAHEVKLRDSWCCQKCGEGWGPTTMHIEAAHIVPRRYKATRYLLENGIALCHKCHRDAHEDQTAFMQWVRGELDPTVLAQLQQAVPNWKGWRT